MSIFYFYLLIFSIPGNVLCGFVLDVEAISSHLDSFAVESCSIFDLSWLPFTSTV